MQIQRDRYHRGEITREELRMRARKIYEQLVAELIAIGPPKNVFWKQARACLQGNCKDRKGGL
jgi:hypothetical protein